ncbi:MAG: hypothetical protein JXO51_09180 [Candidatus Aminicenantes bacterium]|nr:hypothetical protein [Candidatus Aminicenantes bacterium]
MSILKLFAKAFGSTARQGRLARRLWALNFLFSLLIIAPLAVAIHGHASHSLAADSVLVRLDVHWLTDLSTRYMESAPMLLALLAAAVLAYLLLVVFLNGGVIGRLGRPPGADGPAAFFHDCGLYFWRFLRVALLSIPFYLIAAGVIHRLVAALLGALTRRAATEWPVIIASGLRLLALVLLLGIVSMFFDYVKIGLVTRGSRKVLKEAWRTLKFVGRRFFRAWGLYLLAGLAFVLLTLAYLEVARVLPKGTPPLVLAVFVWQQMYVLGRQFSRILFFASEIEFARQEMSGAREKIREE